MEDALQQVLAHNALMRTSIDIGADAGSTSWIAWAAAMFLAAGFQLLAYGLNIVSLLGTVAFFILLIAAFEDFKAATGQ